MITGHQLRNARKLTGMSQKVLARKAGVGVSIVERAENSPGDPMVTISQLNALMNALQAAGTTFPPIKKDGSEEQP